MMNQNKKILFGLVALFILSLNIYNIPLDIEQKNLEKIAYDTFKTSESKVDFDSLNAAVNKSLKSPVNFMDYEFIFVTYWATWCPSCKKENEILNEFSKMRPDILVLGVCIDSDLTALDTYLESTPLEFNVFNNTKDVALHFDDIIAVPTHFVIDVKKGSVFSLKGLLSLQELKGLMTR